VNVLDSKRSLNVNIFLRQFRMTPSELVACLRRAVPRSETPASASAGSGVEGSGSGVELSLERLRGLQRVLPEPDDIDTLTAFDGDVGRLGTAEKFYLELIQLPQWALLYGGHCDIYIFIINSYTQYSKNT